jgi:hypothetical protein
MYSHCQQARHKLVRSYGVGAFVVGDAVHQARLLPGFESQPDSQHWVQEPCNTPLFADTECESGLCRSCSRGWTHPENHPAGSCHAGCGVSAAPTGPTAKDD